MSDLLGVFLYAYRAIAPLLLLMAFGYVVVNKLGWDRAFFVKLNRFCFHFLLPIQMFYNVYGISNLSALNWRLVGFIICSIFVTVLIGVTAARLVTDDPGQRAAVAQASFRSNQVIMGIPLAEALGGAAAMGFASVATSICVPIFNILGVVVLNLYLQFGGKKNASTIVRGVLRNPLVVGVSLGLIVLAIRGLIPIQDGAPVFTLAGTLPSVFKVLSDLSKVATPLMLFVLGTQIRFDEIPAIRKQLAATVFIKLILVPAVVLTAAILLRHPLGLTSTEMPTMVAIFCSPVAVTSAVMVQEIGGDKQLASQAVAWSTALSLLTIFVAVVIFRSVGLL